MGRGSLERGKDKTRRCPANIDSDRKSRTEDHPFGLLSLQGTGDTRVAVEWDGHEDRRLAEKHEIANLKSVDGERERCMWEEDGRNLYCETHDGGPAREARHELPGGKQREDEHEQAQSEEVQAFVR